MSYTASRITSLKNSCPICLGDRPDCRSTGELVHCYSHNEPPEGYDFKGLSKIGASLYAPSKDASKPFDVEVYRINREARLAEQTKQRQQVIDTLPSLETRDHKIKGYPKTITVAQNADLLRRGLTQADIDLVLSRHWIFGLRDGYGVAAYDPISGLLVGAQKANDDRTDAKYTWGVFAGRNQLKETGENPLFTWVSPNFDSSKPYEIKYSEGSLKSLIRAFSEWRSSHQVIVIGAAGGIFGDKALERVLSALPNGTSHTLLCDADSQNAKKLNLEAAYGNLAKAVPSIKFGDWGQWQHKAAGDCDETFDRDSFNGYKRRSPKYFLEFFEELRRKAWGAKQQAARRSHYERSKIYTPDADKIFCSQFLTTQHFPVPESNSIVALKSTFGTGKTTLMKEVRTILRQQNRERGAVLGGYRVTLLRQTSKKWGFSVINDKEILPSDASADVSACLDSFIKSKWKPEDFDGRILILDEVDAVKLHGLMSGTLKDNRDEVLELFTEAIQRADIVILLSATLTDFDVQYISDLRNNPTTEVLKYENTYRRTAKIAIVEEVVTDPKAKYDPNSRQAIRTMIAENATKLSYAKDGKFTVVSDSQAELKAMERRFQDMGLNVLRIDSETTPEADIKVFLKNPDGYLAMHMPDVLLLSPSANSGVDISIEDYFENLYALSFGVVDVDSFIQMIFRVRDVGVQRYLACPDFACTNGDGEDSRSALPKEVEKSINDYICDFGILAAQGLPTGEALQQLIANLTKQSSDRHFQEYCKAEAGINYEKTRLLEILKERLSQLGYEYEVCQGERHTPSLKALRECKKENEAIDSQIEYESESLDIRDAKQLARKEQPFKVQLQIRKAFLKERLPDIDTTALWSPEFIKFVRYSDRTFLSKIESRYLIQNMHIAKLRSIDKLDWLADKEQFCKQDLKAKIVRLTALRDIGILDLTGYAGKDLHADHELILSICKKAKERTNKTRLGRYQGKLTNIQFVNGLTKLLGFQLKNKSKGKNYSVCDEAREAINATFKENLPSTLSAFDIVWNCVKNKFERYEKVREKAEIETVARQKNADDFAKNDNAKNCKSDPENVQPESDREGKLNLNSPINKNKIAPHVSESYLSLMAQAHNPFLSSDYSWLHDAVMVAQVARDAREVIRRGEIWVI